MQYDLIFRNGMIIDGSGRKRYQGDIAVRRAVIEEIGNLSNAETAREIDVQGKIVCPGFIDIHSPLYSLSASNISSSMAGRSSQPVN
jgi:N-acyl-D-amino-acid deacylase